MADHYFTPAPQSEHRPAQFTAEYRGNTLTFTTDSGVFSRTGLDKGSETLLEALPQETLAGQVLDLGCGYGALGVSIGKANPGCAITMADINQRAVALAQENAAQNGVAAEALPSDGLSALAGRKFDTIVLNPPIRAGKQVIYRLFAQCAAALAPGGVMYIVIRKQQGAPSAKAYLQTLFGGVEIIRRSGGYWVLHCTGPETAE